MEEKIKVLFENLRKRNIEGIYCENRDSAHQKLLSLIPSDASIGFSGSQTLEQLEVVEMLESRGNTVFNQYNSNLSVDESIEIRRKGVFADFYLCSANAIAETGELVFLSAYGHRTAGIASARNVIVIAGINKLSGGVFTALKRAREVATPLNCKRLQWDSPCCKEGICHSDSCFYPDYKRMCCQTLIIESEVIPDRLTVMLLNEELGF